MAAGSHPAATNEHFSPMGTASLSRLKESALPAFRAQQNEATVSPLFLCCPSNQQEVVRILSSPICIFFIIVTETRLSFKPSAKPFLCFGMLMPTGAYNILITQVRWEL
jgi:hypothetical protein